MRRHRCQPLLSLQECLWQLVQQPGGCNLSCCSEGAALCCGCCWFTSCGITGLQQPCQEVCKVAGQLRAQIVCFRVGQEAADGFGQVQGQLQAGTQSCAQQG